MEKFVPADKLSKKKRRALHARRRKTWGGLNPVTRKPADPKAYNRKKARKWSDDTSIDRVFLFAEKLHAFSGDQPGCHNPQRDAGKAERQVQDNVAECVQIIRIGEQTERFQAEGGKGG